MKRRTLLAGLGAGVVGTVIALNGSEISQTPLNHPGTLDTTFVTNGDYPTDSNPRDGRAPTVESPPESPNSDTSSFKTIDANGQQVLLAPIETVRAWHQRGIARFVDARGLSQYKRSHILSAVSSPAQKSSTGGSIDGWDSNERIVTYCGCPHHLSSIRAAGLQKAGYTNVFVFDEGFNVWAENEYRMSGTSFSSGAQAIISEWNLDGTTASAGTSAYAWATVGRQYEAAPINEKGDYTLHLRFADVDETTPIQVSTPDYSVTKPLGDLATGSIKG